MATCPECDADIEVDEFDVDKGDLISCPDCGANLEVTSTSPVELEAADDDDDEEEDDDEEAEEEDDFDEDDDDVDERRRRDRRRGLGRVSHAPLAETPRPRAADAGAEQVAASAAPAHPRPSSIARTQRCGAPSSSSRRSSWPTAAAWTAPISPTPLPPRSATAPSASPPTVRATLTATGSSRSVWPGSSASSTR